ncbi:acyltransferase family protein [Novosphingobium lindaniclasticum]
MALETLSGRMERLGYTTGFDYLRIGLAAAVVLWHSVVASGDTAARDLALGPVLGPLQSLILPMFFALSGFLVAGSIERSKTLSGFVTLRVIRIMPALAVEVLLSALILGPLLTTLPLSAYFSDPKFFTYLWNTIGHIHYELPGVFESNPRAGIVNISLWTVPYELMCYTVLVGMLAVGLYKRPHLFSLASAALLAAATVYLAVKSGGLGVPGKIHGLVLVLGFLCGVCTFLFRQRIRVSGIAAAISFVAAFVLLSIPLLRPLSVIPATYLTVWLGLQNPRKIMGGDYSYGMYLFAFPIQQVIATSPQLRNPLLIFALAIPASVAYAAFSWHCIEKPIMQRKKKIVSAVEDVVATLRNLSPLKTKTT